MSRVRDFSPSSFWTSTHTRYTPANPTSSPGDGYFGWDHRAVIHNTWGGTPLLTDYRPFEERVPFRPSLLISSIPMDTYSRPTRIIIVNNNLDYGMNPRLPPFLHQFTRRPVSQGNRYVPPTETDESKLTKEEQQTVLNNLHRQTYNHVPKMSRNCRKVNLYYRDLSRDANAKVSGKVKDEDEDGKNCAVCLEDFENGEEVMVTPCKHMFHDECIVPWVKGHGKCPVCRAGLCDKVKENGVELNRNRGTVLMRAEDGLFSDEIPSLIRAVDEAFVLGG